MPVRGRLFYAETGRDPTRVKVFDTTLRDGEQSPGCTMTREEKLMVRKVKKQRAASGEDRIYGRRGRIEQEYNCVQR